MIVVALTGSLATGKSTVSALLSRPPYKLPIIDADVIAREVVEPGTWGYERIVRTFGPDTPDLLLPVPTASLRPRPATDQLDEKDGRAAAAPTAAPATTTTTTQPRPLNRAALGRRVFGSSPSARAARAKLNSIIHPLVRLRMLQLLLTYHLLGHWAVILDVPLLYESGLDIFASVVIMVGVRSPATQWARLRARDIGLSEQEARDRVGSQMAVEDKVERTRARGERKGKVVWNDGGKGDLEGEVKRVVDEVSREGWGPMWRWWLWGSPVGVVLVVVWEVFMAWARRRRGRGGEGKKGS